MFMKKRLLVLTLTLGPLISVSTKSQAYTEKYESERGHVHNTRIGAAIDDTFTAPRNHKHGSYCYNHPRALGC